MSSCVQCRGIRCIFPTGESTMGMQYTELSWLSLLISVCIPAHGTETTKCLITTQTTVGHEHEVLNEFWWWSPDKSSWYHAQNFLYLPYRVGYCQTETNIEQRLYLFTVPLYIAFHGLEMSPLRSAASVQCTHAHSWTTYILYSTTRSHAQPPRPLFAYSLVQREN